MRIGSSVPGAVVVLALLLAGRPEACCAVTPFALAGISWNAPDCCGLRGCAVRLVAPDSAMAGAISRSYSSISGAKVVAPEPFRLPPPALRFPSLSGRLGPAAVPARPLLRVQLLL